MIKKIVAVSLVALLLLPLIGCTPAANPDRNRTTRNQAQTQTVRDNYSSRPDIASRIADSVPDIHNSIVLVKDHIAYVAVNEGTASGKGLNTDRRGDTSRNNTVYDNWTSGGTAGAPRHGTTTINEQTDPGTAGTGSGDDARNRDLSSATRQQIKDVVRQADPSIVDVYVSNDPTLMSRFRSYSDNMIGTRTNAGINELGDVIRRIFPTAR